MVVNCKIGEDIFLGHFWQWCEIYLFGGVDDERMTPMAPMITLRVRPPSQDVSVVSNGRGVWQWISINCLQMGHSGKDSRKRKNQNKGNPLFLAAPCSVREKPQLLPHQHLSFHKRRISPPWKNNRCDDILIHCNHRHWSSWSPWFPSGRQKTKELMIVIKMLPPPEANSPNSGHQLLLIVPLEHRRKELGARHLRDQHGQQGQHDQDC